jgi:hypothetical protein
MLSIFFDSENVQGPVFVVCADLQSLQDLKNLFSRTDSTEVEPCARDEHKCQCPCPQLSYEPAPRDDSDNNTTLYWQQLYAVPPSTSQLMQPCQLTWQTYL